MPNFSRPDSVFENACKHYPTPFHLYDEQGIIDNIHGLQKAFSAVPFKEYFAVKALPNPAVLQIVKKEGCGVDCSSYSELLLAEALGFAGEEIMFSANNVPAEDFQYARKLGARINLDDFTHVEFLEKNGGIPEEICMRFNPGGLFMDTNDIMGSPGQSKYGMTRAQLSEALQILKTKGVKHFGLHAFLSSNTTDANYYPSLAKLLFQIAKELREETGLTISFINLSGGIGIPYLPTKPVADIDAIGAGVVKAYREAFGEDRSVKVYSELGRYLTGSFGWLVCHALHKKEIHKNYIGVDASACDLMRPAMYGAYHHITVVGKQGEEATYDVVGSLCENNDKFAIDRKLPKIDIGDILVIHDTGAHSHAMGYNYNGKMRCAEVLYTKDGNYRLVRRAERLADYFATLDIYEDEKLWRLLREHH